MRVVYWIVTILVCVVLLGSGVAQLGRAEQLVTNMQHMGYPLYFMGILGTWKVLGVLALLAPGLPRLKEWAYAGIVFLLTGAIASHIAVDGHVGEAIPAAVLLVLLAVSYVLRPEGRKLAPGDT